MSSSRWTTIPRQPAGLGPNGRPFCRICHAEVPKGRKTFCSEGCVTTMFLMMGNVRHLTFARDKGICAWCSVDTEPLREYLDHLFSVDLELYERLRSRWNLGFSTFGGTQAGHLWEADHIQPWSEGVVPTMDNLRTLCRACHKERTAAWHRERAASRRGQLAIPMTV